MKVHVHIERLVVDAGLHLNSQQLEAALSEALQAALGEHAGQMDLHTQAHVIERMTGQWQGNMPVAPAVGQALSQMIQSGMVQGGEHGLT